MALDHYVSQVHLRRFYSPSLGGKQMHVIRKSNGAEFPSKSASVCRIEEGNTNTYLTEVRGIEEFLKTIEPRYNEAVEKLARRELNAECVYVIAGFAAYVMSCSPTSMRIHSESLKAILENTAENLDALGVIPPPAPALGGESLTGLLQSGAVKINVDTKYPQAMGIAAILALTARLGNGKWEILRCDGPGSFFTSDFPAAIERTRDVRVLNRIVPLTPDLAVRICPDISLDKGDCDLSFRHFGYRMRRINRTETRALNQLIVRCAEDLIFFRDKEPWVRSFVRKNSGFRVEAQTQTFEDEQRTLLLSRQRIVPIARAW
jgi:hypothetical protein